MTAPMRARALAFAAGAALCMTLAPVGTALAAEGSSIHYTNESLQEYEQQLHGGQVAAVTINKRLRSLRVTLKDGSHVKARYAAKGEPAQLAALRKKHVRVSVLTPAEAEAEAKKVPRKHKLRYIVGGAVLAVVVIVGGVLLIRRRREEE